MKQHFLPDETKRRIEPGEMGLVYTSVELLELDGRVEINGGNEETCLVVLEGGLEYVHEAESGCAVARDMLYLPLGGTLALDGKAVVARFGATCGRVTRFVKIAFADVDADARHKVYGKAENGTLRDVWNCIDEAFDSPRFLVGLCRGATGGWTAWPPHEHGAKREEVYVYFGMDDGFALQCVYTDMDQPDEIALVRNHHVVSIPKGYHPNVGCPKTGIMYVYCMVSVTPEDRSFMDLKVQPAYGDRLE